MKRMAAYYRKSLKEKKLLLQKPGRLKSQFAITTVCIFFMLLISLSTDEALAVEIPYLDATFDSDGIVTHDAATGGSMDDTGNSVIIDDNGNILVTGFSNTSSGNYDMTIWRYDSSGNLDVTFGGGDGIVTHDSAAGGNGLDIGISITVDGSGNILVTGYSASISSNYDMALWRYDSSGNLDTSFGGGDGIVTHNSAAGGNGQDRGNSVTVDGSGNILVTGYSANVSSVSDMVLWRYDSSGNLDTNFGGGDGIVTHNSAAGGDSIDQGISVTVDESGKIIVAGLSRNASLDHDLALWRFDNSGNLDTSFGGGDGIVTHNSAAGGNGIDYGFSVFVNSSGLVLVSGSSVNGSGDEDMVLWRYDSSGSLDTSFGGGDGIVIHNSAAGGNSNDRGNSVTVDGSGRILVAGYSGNASANTDMVLWRYDSSGNLDTSFGGGDGVVTHNSAAGGDSFDFAESMTLDASGNILLAGRSRNASGNDDMTLWRYISDTTHPTTTASPGFGSYSAPQAVTLSCTDALGSACDTTYYCLGSGCSSFTVYSTGQFVNISTTTDLRYYSNDLAGNTENVLTLGYTITDEAWAGLGVPDWVATWDGGELDQGLSVVIDGTGNLLVVGNSYSGGFSDFGLVRFTSGGVLDTSFGGGDGVVTWDGGAADCGYSVTTDGSGNILVAGYSFNGNYNDFTLVRFTSGGVLDMSFGGGDGVVTLNGGVNALGYSVTTDGSGNILVAGYSSGTTDDFALTRFTSSGVLDTSFGGGDGVATWDGGLDDVGRSVVIDGSGNILVAGYSHNGSNNDFALVRFTSGGVLDTSFGGGDGVITWDGGATDYGYSVITDGSGNILVAGFSNISGNFDDFALWRFTFGGVLDTSFGGGDGVATWNGGLGDQGRSVVIDGSGNILVAGKSFNGSTTDFAILRFTSNGVLDTSFGGVDGVVTWDSGSNDIGHSIVIDGSGNIFVAGYSHNGSNNDYTIIKYLVGSDTTAPITTASPGFGSYSTAQNVTLTCDDGSGCDTTYYCMGIGCSSFTVYSSGQFVNISSTTDLRYYSSDLAGNTESVNTVSYTIGVLDTTPPTTIASPGFGAYTTAQNVTLTCDDGVGTGCDETYYCTGIGCSAFIVYSSAINISLPYTELSFYSTDLAGNVESVAMENYSIVVVDTTAPVTTASPGFGTYSSPQNVTLSCDDGVGSGCAATYYCLGLECSSFMLYSGTGQFINITSSTGFRFYSVDHLDNTENVQSAGYSMGEGEIGLVNWTATWDGGSTERGHSVSIDNSGNILIAGESYNGSNSDLALTRFTAEGVQDMSFGGGDGIVTWDGGSTDRGDSVTIDGSGNILVAGYGINGSQADLVLTRFTADGILDTSFGGGDGVVTWDGGSNDYGHSVAIDSSGNILVAGESSNGGNENFVLLSFSADGVLDTSFGGGDGVATWDGGLDDFGRDMTIDGSGNILVAGESYNGSNSDFALTRFTADGLLDTSFGDGDGAVSWDGGSTERGYSVTIDGSGNIFVAGYVLNGGKAELALTRFTVDGVLDTNFGDGDGVVTSSAGSTDNGGTVAVDDSGNILVGGYDWNGGDENFVLFRFTSNGFLDTRFGGGDGIVTWDSARDIGRSVAIDIYGNIFLAGYTLNGSDVDLALVKYVVSRTPVITSDGGEATASLNAVENQTAVTTVTATDADSDPILFAITGGFDQAAFNIHSSTGVLTFNSAPDYEIPGDSDANNIYIVEVTASDGVVADVQTISVTVTDSEETPPVTTVSPGFGIYPTSQNVTLSCFDGSGSGCATTYYCIGSACSSFAAYSSAGQVINIFSSTDLRYYSSDLAGNTESVKTGSYTIDTLAPFGSVVIDGGSVFAHSTSVTLSLSAFDVSSNVSQMQISNDGAFDAEPWESYSTVKAWTLSAGDGTKEVYVRFQDSVGNVSPSYSDSITVDTSTAPADVTNLNATSNNDGSITLYWTASTSNDINGYNVYRDAVKVNSELIKSTNYIDSDTTNGTSYAYKVTAVGLTGKESSGATVGATSTVEVSTPPASPEGLNIENSGTGDSLKVMWPANSETDLGGYRVYWGTETGNYTANFDVANLTYYTINGLTTGTLYYIAVTAYDIDLNESEKSIEQTATPELVATKPDPVTGLTVTEGNSYLTLNWDAVADISGYMVYIGESDGLYGVPVRTTDTNYTFENLNNGKTYYVAVSSYDLEPGHTYTASSVSDKEASSGTPYDNDSPAIPGNLSATDGGTGGTVVLSWDRDDSFDIAGYVVTYKKTGDVVFEGIDSTGISWSYAVTGLVDNISYDFSVYSYDASGNFSEPVSVTETPTSSGSSSDIIPPEAPLLSALPGDNKVTLLITAPADDDVDHYNIYIYNLAAGKFMPLSSVNGLIHEENSVVTNGSVFDFVATAVDTSGNESGYSVPVSAVPSELPGDIELEIDPPVLDRVDGYDIVEIAKGFGKEIGHPHFNPNTDLNGDGKIDGEDVTILAPNHGKKKGL